MDLKRPISYRWRLFFPLVALLWFIIIAMALFQYEREKSFRAQSINNELALVNARIINAYEHDFDIGPFMHFIATYYENSTFRGIRVSVYNNDGMLLYCIGTPIPCYNGDDELPPELAEATINGSGVALRRSEVETENPYYFFGASKSADGRIYVHTAMPYTVSLSEAMSIDRSLWIIILAFAVAVTVIAYLSTRYLGKNVALLHQFANRVASGENFNFDNEEFPHDELGDISRQIVSLYQEKMAANERSEREHEIALKAIEEKVRVTKQMSNNINHELKTPVGVIKGYLDTIVSHPEMDAASLRHFIGKACGHMDRLCNMLNDLSSITRLEEGRGKVLREPVDMHQLVSNIASEIDKLQPGGTMKFEYDIPPNTVVNGNYSLLYGMLVNLIRNAGFHSHGTVEGIRLVSGNQRNYTFSFYDDGTGVESEHLPHLFDRFYRVDKGRSRKVGGTGLGLPIVKNTVIALGGAIRVANRVPHGLEFVFTLPKYDPSADKKGKE